MNERYKELEAKIKELENNRQQDAITINKNEQEINNLQKALKNTEKERDGYQQDINNARSTIVDVKTERDHARLTIKNLNTQVIELEERLRIKKKN